MMDNLKEEEAKIREQELLVNYSGDDQIITSKEAWDAMEEERKKPAIKYLSQFSILDQKLNGFRQGDVVVVSGITKHGKTTFCQTLTVNFAKQDIPCAWFSFEMAPREFLEKFKPELPNFVLPARLKTSSLKWLEERIVEAQAKYGAKIIFIDHLHFLLDMNSAAAKNTSLMIGAIMRELKKIALYREVCIFLVAHTTKIKYDQAPEVSDIRDSSFIAQEADTVLMVSRAVKEGVPINVSWVSIVANRRTGMNAKIEMIFNDGYFTESFEKEL